VHAIEILRGTPAKLVINISRQRKPVQSPIVNKTPQNESQQHSKQEGISLNRGRIHEIPPFLHIAKKPL
jgi:hypothetical protein